MKITLRDFGPISHFEFDLEKDLHVIFGKNNIGKSYAITAVYLILKNWINEDFKQTLSEIKYNLRYIKTVSETENYIRNDLKNNTVGKIEITKEMETILTNLFFRPYEHKDSGVIKELENSFNNSFPPIKELSNYNSGYNFTIKLAFKNYSIEIGEINGRLKINRVDINIKIIAQKTNSIETSLLWGEKWYINFKENDPEILSNCIMQLIEDTKIEIFSKINNVYFLPASRSGLYQTLNSFSPIIAELSKNRHLLTKKIELPSISEPVADYFLNLSSINNIAENEFSYIIERIEKDILNGQILFNNETKKIVFKQNATELDLSFASSMVSEIAPIVAYLKYIINDKNNDPNAKYGLLFIEEPEAHLHPEVQVKLMEMFALLAGKNVKIVMTSHSNYMFNKLSNLILEGKIDYNKVGSYLMRATDIGSVTDTLSMKAEADGMNDENFADVAEMLYEERIKIYDKLNKEAKNAD